MEVHFYLEKTSPAKTGAARPFLPALLYCMRKYNQLAVYSVLQVQDIATTNIIIANSY